MIGVIRSDGWWRFACGDVWNTQDISVHIVYIWNSPLNQPSKLKKVTTPRRKKSTLKKSTHILRIIYMALILWKRKKGYICKFTGLCLIDDHYHWYHHQHDLNWTSWSCSWLPQNHVQPSEHRNKCCHWPKQLWRGFRPSSH